MVLMQEGVLAGNQCKVKGGVKIVLKSKCTGKFALHTWLA